MSAGPTAERYRFRVTAELAERTASLLLLCTGESAWREFCFRGERNS